MRTPKASLMYCLLIFANRMRAWTNPGTVDRARFGRIIRTLVEPVIMLVTRAS